MENHQLPWAALNSTARLTRELARGKRGLVLLLSAGSDTKSCCAANFERTLFRSPKLVKYAKQTLVPYRVDRSFGVGKALYAKYDLSETKPAVLVVDEHGDVLYKTQCCTEPRDFLKGMQVATLVSKKRQAYSPTVTTRLKSARQSIKAKEHRDALITLGKIKKNYLTAPLRSKVKRYYKKIESDAKKRLKVAAGYEKKNDLERAGEVYREVARNFSRLKKVKTRAQAGLKRVLKKKAEKNKA